MRVYCQKCGQPTEYSIQGGKPKFCSHCGQSYGVSEYHLDATKGSKSASKSAPEEHKPIIQLEEEFPDDAVYVPDISKLQIDIDTTHERPPQMTIGDLAGSKIDGVKDEPRLGTPESNMSSEEFLQSFQKEAGSLRPKGSDNG
jgi:hypothetical protein